MEAEYYYLKVRAGKIQNIGNIDYDINKYVPVKKRHEVSEKIPRDFDFGTLHELFKVRADYAVLKVDTSIRDKIRYSTNKKALEASIKFLGKKGYEAKPVDLEGLLESI